METPQKKKSHKGGTVVRTEPADMHLFEAEPMAREVFQRVGCLTFCQNMQRGHPEVARKFSLHFDGLKTKVGDLEFEVSETSISAATGIPITGENWFKSMALDAAFSKDFLKPEYQTDNLSKGVPRSHLVGEFDKMLRIIQRYFTCEGRFNTLYQYHIRLLLHFTGKVEMNIPFYLLRSIGKMSDRVQSKSKAVDTSIFHSGLIRMLVSEELRKRNISWEHFIASSHMKLDIAATPQSQIPSPFPSTSVAPTGANKKRKSKAHVQDQEAIKEVARTEEEAYHSPQRDLSPPPAPELEEVPSSTKATTKKGRKLHFSSSPSTTSTKIRKPFTRSSTLKGVVEEQVLPKVSILKKKKDKGKGIEKPVEIEEVIPVQQEDEAIKNPVETVHITTPPSNQTFKRLIKQLREARKEVARLKSEALSERIKMKELMDGYNHTLDLAIFAARRAQPLHRKLKNLYRKNRDFQSQNRKLKAELQQFQDEMAQRNLNVLVEAAIEKEKPVAKESIAPVKKHVTTKGKHVVVPKGSPPSTRRSVRLMK
jgi:hypothetical protein